MQLALGAVGAAAGNFLIPGGFLGMSGASLGWSFGSMVGGLLGGGQTVEGPRLQDKTISVSAYGNLRPIVYGTYRVGGEVIWAAPIKEHKNEEEQGKGGGATYVTYTYTVSFAVALCEGVLDGVRKIWLDSKLVYSVADDADPAELYKSSKIAKGIYFYPGTTTQTADPTIQSYLGAANVPGYRGTAYIVFKDLDITKYGNRIPQVTVEVCRGETTITGGSINTTYTGNVKTTPYFKNGLAYFNSGGNTDDDSALSSNIMRLSGTISKSSTASVPKVAGVIANSQAYAALAGQAPYYWGAYAITPSGNYLIADVGRNTGTARYVGVLSRTGSNYLWIGLCITQNDLLDNVDSTDRAISIRAVENDDLQNPLSIYIYHFVDGKLYRFDVILNLLGGYVLKESPSWMVEVDSSWYDTNGNNGHWPGFCVDDATGDIYCLLQNNDTSVTSVKRFDSEGEFIEEKFVGTAPSSSNISANISFSNGLLWTIAGNAPADTAGLKVYDWATETLVYQASTVGIVPVSAASAGMVAAGNLMTLSSYGTVSLFKLAMTRASMTLDEVVEDLCVRSGLEAADVDVTDLASDNVRGMVVGRQMSGRGAIQHLGGPYFFDGVESDGILKFVKRGGSSVATLEDEDMGCYEGEVVELWKATRTQEEELPQKLTFMYSRFDADYQQGAQYALREAVLSGNNMGVEFSIAFTDNEAKEIVDTLMFTAWQNRHGFQIPTWQKFAKVEPTDIIVAGGETLRVTRRDEGVNGLIDIECVRELPAIYTGQVGTGASGSVGGQSVDVAGPTDYELLDIPNLRDRDYNSYGLYWAAAGYLDDWDGAAILKSPDNGDNFTLLETTNTAGVFGQAVTELGDFASGNIFDEINKVRVSVNGTLSSATWDEVLNGANPILIGDEILQFRTATLVSTGVYDLTGLLRGRRGTEWAMSDHAVNERVVFLDESSLHFVALDSTDFNVQRMFGAVTAGDTIEDVETKFLTYTGENLKPFNPVHLSATFGTNGSIYLNWEQRTRYQGLWLSGLAPSDDETTIEWEVAIYSDSNFTTLLRTTTDITSTPWEYTQAMQNTDFGYYVKSIHFKVRQVGASRNSEWSSYSGIVTNIGSTMLLHFNGTQDSTVITDAYGHSFSCAGNGRLRTEQAKFGSASFYCDGTNDRALCAYNIDLDPEYFDFTAECWIYPQSYRTDTAHLMGTYTNGSVDGGTGHAGWQLGITSGGNLAFNYGVGGSLVTVATSASPVGTGAYKHVAVTRQGNTVTLWVEGASVGTGTLTGDIRYTKQFFYIGSRNDAGSAFGADYTYQGYLDEARFTKGLARYTGAFTPSSTEFTG
jgi:hypothetical protein